MKGATKMRDNPSPSKMKPISSLPPETKFRPALPLLLLSCGVPGDAVTHSLF
jgi:hypothetical protein